MTADKKIKIQSWGVSIALSVCAVVSSLMFTTFQVDNNEQAIKNLSKIPEEIVAINKDLSEIMRIDKELKEVQSDLINRVGDLEKLNNGAQLLFSSFKSTRSEMEKRLAEIERLNAVLDAQSVKVQYLHKNYVSIKEVNLIKKIIKDK